MADAVVSSIAEFKNQDKYIRRDGVPWFRPHVREIWNEKLNKFEQVEVLESDLTAIAEQMQALASEGRAFRITNGHIDKGAKEEDQPDLLGMALNPRVGTFGPKNVPCVLLDEYILADKVASIGKRPYRSAEYYRQKKVITGCAALLRDPQLNLGTVLYSGDDAMVVYAEPVSVIPEASSNDADLSPEEIELFERFLKYQERKQSQQQPQQNAMGAMGPNANMPQPAAYQEQDMAEVVKPEDAIHYAELTKRAESAEKRLAEIEKERVLEKSQKLIERLAEVEHFKFDTKEELELMQATDDAGREKIAARIRKYHEKLPGHDDEVPVHYEGEKPLPKHDKTPNDEPEFYQETLDYIRKTGEQDFEKANRIVRESKKSK